LISRRGFLRGSFGRDADPRPGAENDRARRRAAVLPMLRPPGAVDEPAFLRACTLCDRCIDACPHDVLFRAPEQFREAAGTPTYDAARAPCLLCADTPCVAACETGALRPDLGFAMGTAHIDTQACLAHQGTFCSVCHERCPVPGAIAVDRGKPRIEVGACTGCGICLHVCPAPYNAVVLMPSRERLRAPGGGE
jgi:ferredoxin-type protein NapG